MSRGAQQASARVAAKNAVKIRAALKASVDGRRVYAQYMETNPPVTKDRVLDRARARAWAMSNVKLDLSTYQKVLAKHYADMYVLGQSEAAENMANRAQKGPVATATSKPKLNPKGQVIFDPSFSINWDNWVPGNAAAAALISKPGGLKQLLDKADVQSEGIAKYGYDLIGTTVANGIANGDTPTQIGNAIADAISSPERALTIAITEGQRAKISANVDSYAANGVEQIEWTTNDPCPECEANDGKIVTLGDDFPSGDQQPPAHPNCQCDVIPVMPDLSGSPEYADLTDEEVAARLEMGAEADLGKYSPDQERDDHGRFGSGGGATGGNGLNHREIYNLQSDKSDLLQKAVYQAEQKYQPDNQRDLPRPFPPSRNSDLTRAEYDKAYKEYSKNFTAWSRETTRNIQSLVGEKNLNGTPIGVQKYVNEVTSQPWFVEKFGNGGVIGTPKTSLTDANVAGKYSLGFKRGEGVTSLAISRGYSKNEPTIMHEIAHYATAISQTTPFEGHGVEFATNHVYIASNLVSPEYGAGLARAYREAGVNLG